MFAPKLYSVYKIPIRDIFAADYNIVASEQELKKYIIKQQDGSLLRQLRLITGDCSHFNRYIIFVNIDNKNPEIISYLAHHGFEINGFRFVLSERSASMTRTGILSFVDETIEPELNRRITMDITFDKIVLSKYYAYRGLLLSACHMIEDYVPKVIVVPDHKRVIKDQTIKYAFDSTTEFIDKDGNERTWTQKDIATGVRDITIDAFDGCGICHPSICRDFERMLGSKTPISTMIFRAPYIKGCLVELDYEAFYTEHNIEKIQDVWGVWHDFSEPMIIVTESMYKGIKYFKHYGDYRDWERYWQLFHKYQHAIGIAKWNFTADEEMVYTRANYQILQDLELPYEQFRTIANYSIDWVDGIINGDPIYTYCFLGMFADSHKAKNEYVKAILKNPEMIKELSVKKYLSNLLAKYRDEMKCGKLWIKSTFKFLLPDLIMLMQHIGGLEPVGCLEADEFYSHNKNGPYIGEYLIERNPHICKSEHVILKGVSNDMTSVYCSHLDNVCMINSKSITPQRLNGADFDGDIVNLIDNKTMMAGVDTNVPVVIDIEDKITALAEEDNADTRTQLILRTINSLIGETSNCATGYHNKLPRSEETKEKYSKYIDLLSIINGKAIDYAKTGVLYNIPRHIAKYSKPLPYFMKYASDYYAGLNTFSHAMSNMNRLCKDIERWCKVNKYSLGRISDFDYEIMIDDSIENTFEEQEEINKLFLAFTKEMAALAKDQAAIRKYGDDTLSKFDSRNFSINWNYYYDKYREKCNAISTDNRKIANMAVRACYEFYPQKRNSRFMWVVAGQGIVENITQVEFDLPIRDNEGEYEYLGKKYSLVKYNGGDDLLLTNELMPLDIIMVKD